MEKFIEYFRQKIALQNARKLHALKKQCAVDSDQLSTDPMLRWVFALSSRILIGFNTKS